ncbi:MAG: DUF1343 domain-containing protein [Bradymonadales bacterium]|jgi:uncharacterized protein YbbC (DUF1343 family)
MRVASGLDLFVDGLYEAVKDKRIALLSHSASITAKGEHAIFALRRLGLELKRLFSPEHGLWGLAQDMESVEHCVDPVVGQEVISLYGEELESLKPTDEVFEGLDVVIIDLQDVGARYYTYNYTAWFLARAALQKSLEVYILDRPNPLGGRLVEGNLVEDAYRSFVGEMPIPTRHGMTTGELLGMWAHESGLWSKHLHIVRMKGWERGYYFDDCGLPWVAPSPNMPTLATAIIYPGMCLLEGTKLSEARGTTKPFEQFGAPWFKAHASLEALESLCLPGVYFRPVSFRPMFQKQAMLTCTGLEMHVFDRDAFRPLLTGLAVIAVSYALHPQDFAWRSEAYEFVTDRLAIDLLLGNDRVRMQIQAQENPWKIVESMNAEAADFARKRASFLLY